MERHAFFVSWKHLYNIGAQKQPWGARYAQRFALISLRTPSSCTRAWRYGLVRFDGVCRPEQVSTRALHGTVCVLLDDIAGVKGTTLCKYAAHVPRGR